MDAPLTEIAALGILISLSTWAQQSLLLKNTLPGQKDTKAQAALVITLAMNALMCARTLSLRGGTDSPPSSPNKL